MQFCTVKWIRISNKLKNHGSRCFTSTCDWVQICENINTKTE
jgi:hypothetical protein